MVPVNIEPPGRADETENRHQNRENTMRVVIVEDDRITRQWLKSLIERLGEEYYVMAFSNGRRAFNYIVQNQADVLFIDTQMPAMNGLELLSELVKRRNTSYKVLLTTVYEIPTASRAMELGANRIIIKPDISLEELDKVLRRARAYLLQHEYLDEADESMLKIFRHHGKTVDWPGRLGGSETAAFFSLPVQKLIQFIEEHYWERVSLARAADTVYLSKSYVSVLFKKETGWKFCEYLQEVRLKNACDYLAGSRMPIQEVAAATGFFDTPHFTRVFKARMGVPPSRYRKLKERSRNLR